ncbi:MAG: ATPase P [Eubacterium sp.]|nr:ATPase P [Eubacterium sp.]
MTQVTLEIDGMMCGMCEAHVKDIIRKAVPEAKKVRASHYSGKASFLMDSDSFPEAAKASMIKGTEEFGYHILNVSTEKEKTSKGIFGKLFAK